MPSDTRILLVGNQAVLMGSIAARLEYVHHHKVMGIVGSPEEAAERLTEDSVDLVILDADGVESGAAEGTRAVRSVRDHLPVILFGAELADCQIESSLDAGACGFVLKEELSEALPEAIREVLAGGFRFPKSVQERIVIGTQGVRLSRPS